MTLDQKSLPSRVIVFLGRRALLWLVADAFGSLVLAIVELGVSLFLQQFLKSLGLLNQEVQTSALFGHVEPLWLAGALCMLGLARSLAQFFVGQSAIVSMEMIAARLRRISTWESLLVPRAIVSAGAVNARVGDLASKASLFCFAGASVVSYVITATALVVIMFITARGETLIALAGLLVLGALVSGMNRKTRKVAAGVPGELRLLTEGIERVTRNATLVRVLRTQQIEQGRLAWAIDSYARRLVNAGFLGSLVSAATPFAGIVLLVVIVGSSQRYFHTPGITLLSFLYLFVRFVQAVSGSVYQLSSCNTTWSSFKDSLDYVSGFTTEEIEQATHESSAPPAIERAMSTGGEPPGIAIRSVGFRYARGGREVLDRISMDVPAGAQIAIVGPSGCGKSTLLALILGLLEPTHGEVRVGGRTPSEYFDDPDVRVGYVGADAFLIAGTIRDNLRYGLSTPVEETDLWSALARARLGDDVEAMPDRLEYRLSEDGSGLSAGQKQRLCLARAILNRPHVLILDEVSANLDVETEKEIASTLKELRGRVTTILVSHRDGILEHADAVISLAKTQSVEV